MKKPSRGCLWALGVIAAVFLTIWIVDTVVPSGAVRALPKGATDIQEYYRDAGMTGDFTRILKARIPREDVAEYARKFGATHKTEGRAGRVYASWGGYKTKWWNPQKAPLYFSLEGDTSVLVGWEDGFVYFEARST
jgi:hypothetical protein